MHPYLLEIEGVVFLIVSNGVVFLVIKTNAGFVNLADSLIGECVEKVDSLIHHNVVLDIWILLILEFEVVGWECLDG